ncbi:MAG TPA: EAL domain-containing protein [Burkholderiales bacterium]|nr:EAL domain-containing protein [Burkholderiales bacterium]
MKQELRLLIVEDQPADAELLQRELRRGGVRFAAQCVDTREGFERSLVEFAPDLILSDFSMPAFDGLAALDLVQSQTPDTPFIFFSGTIGEDRAAEALKRGATDYVLKDRPRRLISAIERALDEAKKRIAMRNSQHALQMSEERFRSFMQHLPARASITDLEGRYTFVNETWQRTTGVGADAAVGRPYYEMLPADRAAALEPYHQQVVATNRPVSRIYRVGSEGNLRWWFANYFPIPDAEGKVAMIGTVGIDITEQKLQEERLNYLAYYDALTGLPNHALFQERLSQALREAGEKETHAALIVWNVNRLGLINESLGHHAGDALLRELAGRLRSAWSDPDKVARITADCFAGFVTDVKDAPSTAHQLESAMTQVFAAPFVIDGKELAVSMTAGIAVSPADGSKVDALLRNAEAAMKRAKALSAHWLFYQPAMNATVTETLMLENKLRRALDTGRLELHYQPKLDLMTGKLTGLEALLRWNDPDVGTVAPSRFIQLMEETGLIIEAGQWALRRALADFHAWREAGLQPPRIAVNVSAIQLAQENFMEVLRRMVEGLEDGSHGLDLEITESLLMQDIEANIAKLRAIRELGFGIAIDDFGTGFSSLGYLARLPINALKIDRSFVVTMTRDADSMTIVSTIISLAHALKLSVIAEGVETEEQQRLLKVLKCEVIQGYLFHKPLPPERIMELLRPA